MIGHFILLSCILASFAFCAKKTVPAPPKDTPVIKPRVRFLFINKIGFRNDSVSHDSTYTLFRGPCIDTKFYSIEKNNSQLVNVCYNRDFAPNNHPTVDSIPFIEYELSKGSKLAAQVQLGWCFTLYFDRLVNSGKMTVTNELGLNVYESELTDCSKIELNLRGLVKGLFFLKINSNVKIQPLKFIVE